MVDCMVDNDHISAITTRFTPNEWYRKKYVQDFFVSAQDIFLCALYFFVWRLYVNMV